MKEKLKENKNKININFERKTLTCTIMFDGGSQETAYIPNHVCLQSSHSQCHESWYFKHDLK